LSNREATTGIISAGNNTKEAFRRSEDLRNSLIQLINVLLFIGDTSPFFIKFIKKFNVDNIVRNILTAKIVQKFYFFSNFQRVTQKITFSDNGIIRRDEGESAGICGEWWGDL